VSNQDGNDAMLPLAYINKANILFIREVEGGQTSGLGGATGHKLYPFVPKLSVAAKVYIPFYILNGLIHFPKGRSIVDALNSPAGFPPPFTDAEIYQLADCSELTASFIAINKAQILSIEVSEGSVNEDDRH